MPTDKILEKLKKKYPALQEEPLMDELSSELSADEDLGPSKDHADAGEDLGQEQDNPDEPASEDMQDEDMGFLSKASSKPSLPVRKFPPKR